MRAALLSLLGRRACVNRSVAEAFPVPWPTWRGVSTDAVPAPDVDCVVVGAGVVGLACARAFALAGKQVLLLEKESAFGTQTSSRHSEVIHAGIYYPLSSWKAKLCVRGKQLLYDYCQQNNVPHKRVTKLIVATNEKQLPQLARLQQQGRMNGVHDLQLLSRQEAQQLEPVLHCEGALLSPSTGILDSHRYMECLLADVQNHGGILAANSRFLGSTAHSYVHHGLSRIVQPQSMEVPTTNHSATSSVLASSAAEDVPSLPPKVAPASPDVTLAPADVSSTASTAMSPAAAGDSASSTTTTTNAPPLAPSITGSEVRILHYQSTANERTSSGSSTADPREQQSRSNTGPPATHQSTPSSDTTAHDSTYRAQPATAATAVPAPLASATASSATAASNTIQNATLPCTLHSVAVQDTLTQEVTHITCRWLVNAAGLQAQQVAAKIEGLPAAVIPPLVLAKGNYFSLTGQSPFSRLIYPLPEDGGLGVHLTLDLAGQAKFGPDVQWVDRIDYTLDPARASRFYPEVRKYWPALPDDALQPSYAGIRPKLSGPGQPAADFVIQGCGSHGVPGIVNLFGIESPGLTSSLALAEAVVQFCQAGYI